MAAVIVTRVIEDGPRNAIILINGTEAAGSTPAYQAVILPSALGLVNQATGQHAASLRVDLIEWDVQAEAGYQVNLFWDATVPVEFYSCIGRANKKFKQFGGLYQQTGISGSTGGIGINTLNPSATVPYAWTLTLMLVKNGLNPA